MWLAINETAIGMSNATTPECPLYYDPETGCVLHLFEQPEYEVANTIFPIVSYPFYAVALVMFALEALADFIRIRRRNSNGTRGKVDKNVLFYIKLLGIVYCLIALVAISLFTWGVVNRSADLVVAQIIVQYVGSSVIINLYMLSVFYWLILILKARNLGYKSTYFKAAVGITVILTIFMGVVVMICMVLDKLDIATNVTKPISIYATVVVTGIVCIANIACGIFHYVWLGKKMRAAGSQSRRLTTLRKKTITILIACAAIIVSSSLTPVNPNMSVQATYLFRLYSFRIGEMIILTCLFIFVQNYATQCSYWTYISTAVTDTSSDGSSPHPSTQSTSSSTKGTRKQRGQLITPSVTVDDGTTGDTEISMAGMEEESIGGSCSAND